MPFNKQKAVGARDVAKLGPKATLEISGMVKKTSARLARGVSLSSAFVVVCDALLYNSVKSCSFDWVQCFLIFEFTLHLPVDYSKA
jgi:hypothetical protein